MPSNLVRRRLPGEASPDAADIAGMMGPLEAPMALGGVLGKVAKLKPEDFATLNDLLGKPIRIGKRLLRLSSGNPAKNTAILHTAQGERVATPLDEFLKMWKTAGEETPEIFPEGAVMSEPGARAPGAALGPKGGLTPTKRRIPPTATR